MSKFRVNEAVQVADLDNELALLNIDTGKYHVINETGKEIWTLIKKSYELDQVVDELVDMFDVEKDYCEKKVDEFVEELVELKVLTEV